MMLAVPGECDRELSLKAWVVARSDAPVRAIAGRGRGSSYSSTFSAPFFSASHVQYYCSSLFSCFVVVLVLRCFGALVFFLLFRLFVFLLGSTPREASASPPTLSGGSGSTSTSVFRITTE